MVGIHGACACGLGGDGAYRTGLFQPDRASSLPPSPFSSSSSLLLPLPAVASPVGSAFRRATTLSLGSICLGSLTVALVSTARSIVQSFISFKALGSCVACIVDAMLASVEALFQNFNR